MSVARPRTLAGGGAPARSKAVVRGKLASLLAERLCEQYGQGCVALCLVAHRHARFHRRRRASVAVTPALRRARDRARPRPPHAG